MSSAEIDSGIRESGPGRSGPSLQHPVGSAVTGITGGPGDRWGLGLDIQGAAGVTGRERDRHCGHAAASRERRTRRAHGIDVAAGSASVDDSSTCRGVVDDREAARTYPEVPRRLLHCCLSHLAHRLRLGRRATRRARHRRRCRRSGRRGWSVRETPSHCWVRRRRPAHRSRRRPITPRPRRLRRYRR